MDADLAALEARVTTLIAYARELQEANDILRRELLALQDINHYVQRQATGGIYPVTSTEVCPSPLKCGTMQSNYPMPFANTGLAAPNNFANSAGVFDWTTGTVTTTLAGRYVRILDTCGAISGSSATGNIAMGGTNGQHDCTTPGTGGAGNTAASRSAFYEVNKIAEMARGYASLADAKAAGATVIAFGSFLNQVIQFLILAWVVFLMVKAVNRMRRKSAPITPPPSA